MTERFIEAGEARLWSTVSGSGTPVILLNGGPGCDDYLAPVADLIEDFCEVVRFEPRGCGRSTWDGNYDLATVTSDIDAVRVAYGFETVVLIGHSFGPDVGLVYSLAHRERVQGLVGIAGGRVVNDREWHKAYEERKAEEPSFEFVADETVNRATVTDYRRFCKSPTLLQALAALSIPARFIVASKDIRPTWPTWQLANLLPNGACRELENADHYPWLSDPEVFRAALREAISEVTA